MKTLTYNLKASTSHHDEVSLVHIRKSDINYDKMIELDNMLLDDSLVAHGWDSEMSTELEYGFIRSTDAQFIKRGSSVLMPSVIKMIDGALVKLDHTNYNWDIAILKRDSGYISKHITYTDNPSSEYNYELNMPLDAIYELENHDHEHEQQYFSLFDENKEPLALLTKASATYQELKGLPHVTVDRSNISENLSRVEKISDIEIVNGKRVIRTSYFPVVEATLYSEDFNIIPVLSIDNSNGILFIDNIPGNIYIDYTVSPAMILYSGEIVYKNEVLADSDINLFELESSDKVFLDISMNSSEIVLDEKSSNIDLSIKMPIDYDSIFLEPSDNIIINNDYVPSGYRYEISNIGFNNLTLSYSMTPLDMLKDLNKDGDIYSMPNYIQGTLASFYGLFNHEGVKSIYHISFNKKTEHTDEYSSGSLNLSNGGLYTVLPSQRGLSIKIDTSISGMNIALPSLALLESIAVNKHFGETMTPVLDWDYIAPGIIKLHNHGIYTIEYEPFINSDLTTVRITGGNVQKSFTDKLSEFGDSLIKLMAIYSKTINIKLGYYMNGIPYYMDEDINVDVKITPSAIKSMVAESKNIIL